MTNSWTVSFGVHFAKQQSPVQSLEVRNVTLPYLCEFAHLLDTILTLLHAQALHFKGSQASGRVVWHQARLLNLLECLLLQSAALNSAVYDLMMNMDSSSVTCIIAKGSHPLQQSSKTLRLMFPLDALQDDRLPEQLKLNPGATPGKKVLRRAWEIVEVVGSSPGEVSQCFHFSPCSCPGPKQAVLTPAALNTVTVTVT